jgi:hypothetical protein
MDSKFCNLWGGWCSFEPVRVFGVELWKNITKGWETLSTFTRFEVSPGLAFGMIIGVGKRP